MICFAYSTAVIARTCLLSHKYDTVSKVEVSQSQEQEAALGETLLVSEDWQSRYESICELTAQITRQKQASQKYSRTRVQMKHFLVKLSNDS